MEPLIVVEVKKIVHEYMQAIIQTPEIRNDFNAMSAWFLKAADLGTKLATCSTPSSIGKTPTGDMPKYSITLVGYEACFNLGDYSNEKIRLEAELLDEESADIVIDQLREKVIDKAQPNAENAWRERMKLLRATDLLAEYLLKMESAWDKASEFLIAQGIKSEVPNFPIEASEAISEWKKQKKQPEQESSKLIQAERISDDELEYDMEDDEDQIF